jgi:hypothetical protein
MKAKIFVWLIVLILIIGGVWYFGIKEKTPESAEQEDKSLIKNNIGQDNTSEVTTEEIPNSLVGELKVSNDKRRGNLMLLLENSDRIIYLNTSRDFSSLVGEQVIVTIDGSLDDFRLVDIKEK